MKKLVTLTLHDHLWTLVEKLPEDYEPWGQTDRDGGDCSCGCKWAAWLEDEPADWLVCTNPRSHRAGKLTFEHMGCKRFEPDDDELDDLDNGAEHPPGAERT